jgi:hypothetical protein
MYAGIFTCLVKVIGNPYLVYPGLCNHKNGYRRHEHPADSARLDEAPQHRQDAESYRIKYHHEKITDDRKLDFHFSYPLNPFKTRTGVCVAIHTRIADGNYRLMGEHH